MPNLEVQRELINETIRQINLTESPQRKYQLHRHLKKLRKEYKVAQNYMRASAGKK